MSSWKVSSVLYLIFKVYWTMFSFCGLVCFQILLAIGPLYLVTFGVFNALVRLEGFIWPWSHFVYWYMWSYHCFVSLLDAIGNRSIIFGVNNGCMMYMYVWWDSYDLEIIFKVCLSMFSFYSLVCFSCTFKSYDQYIWCIAWL